MEHVKFKEAGSWADRPCDPILEVGAGSTHLVSDNLAKVVVDAGKGERVPDPAADTDEAAAEAARVEAEEKAQKEADDAAAAAAADKTKQKTPAKKDKAKSESK